MDTNNSHLDNGVDGTVIDNVTNSLDAVSIRKMWNVRSSSFAKNTHNPIRSIVDGLKLTPNPDKPMIALSIGDPTVFGNFPPPAELTESVKEAIDAGKFNGYGPAVGTMPCRTAIAEYYSTSEAPLEAMDVILASGCSHALELCITALADIGQNILVPRPGFPIYSVLAKTIGIEVKEYELMPQRSWEVNITNMESLIDNNTVAIMVNNPSNPCGSVYKKQHLLEILEVADKHKVPIIADEIYADMVFPGEEFHYLASLTEDVPVLSCGGLAKRWLVPGWRIGWILIHDRHNAFNPEVRDGLNRLSQRIIGCNTLIQGAMPRILAKTPKSFYDSTVEQIKRNADLFYSEMSTTPGLWPIMPQGAMYMMVGLDLDNFLYIKDDGDFAEKLVSEQSVFCLPGKAFNYPGFFRIVLTVPEDKILEACKRIQDFCEVHFHEPIDDLPNHGKGMRYKRRRSSLLPVMI